ncbi:hypothetical protein TVAG_399330 [Trichomonas vaginalis G3]|uniref:I/LWEQ domain-containing protein n=1 Tax=Trichomonas vaginalis (strain ATCC PRA-98 / G3) TaxID=412133 RepID=A2E5X1_TRIV3|nr:I/LWEQ domain family [Trichomonas vaginalis G3]EAY11928.1 hypothetical protein TVAG_399330 [Trichomonas vaginalis G3]KAI5530407.1 I/LWEQ domain family [Trichomonas vaginalis G3]|eukprot:XP_001324151.1 hypothetical protein [Trichomonas vaginalis G3]
MLQIVDKITRFDAIYEIKDLKQNDFENYYKNVMRNLLISLNNLKISIKTPKNNVLFGILSYLNKIEIFQEFCGQKQVETQKSKEIVISGFYKSSTIDDLINQFLRYLTNVDSVLYHGISMMVDQDNMVNIAYDKSEIFRNEIKKGKEGKISEVFLSVSDIFVIVSHVLSISDYIETPLSLKCSITFLSLIQKLAKYNSDMKKGSKNKDFINNLINDLDYLINIIEYPKFKEPSTPTSFRLSQYGFYNLVLRLSTIFSFIIELSTWSVIPLMYEEGQRDFLSLMNAYIPITQTCSSYFSNLDPKIKKIYEKFENSAQNLVNESKNIRIGPDFESFLPALNSFASDLISLSNSISEMKQEMSIKIDKNVINQIPDDYILPVTPEIGRLPISVFNEIKILSKPFDEILTKISSKLSSIDENKVKEIIKSLIEFRKIAENFCEISLSMISSIPDFSNQIRVQTVLYNISSLISSLQNIVRSKLLGTLQNDKEISENLTKIKCQKEKLINLTQEISSQNVVKNNDDASNSLTVCAQEVGETLSKLFVLDEKQKSNFDSKILLSAARIVERARQLTMMQIEKHGHIDNEKGMIHAAGEVTEAVKLFLIVAEMKNDEDLNYKIVSAAKIINASVASLVACVNVKGGDKEKIINDEIKNLKNFTEKIIKETEAKIFKKLEENDKKDNKKVMIPVILKLNLQNEINAQWKKCEEEEKKLYEFRKRKI